MSVCAMVSIEGVLARGSVLLTAGVDNDALRVVRGLSQNHMIVFSSLSETYDDVNLWLGMQGLSSLAGDTISVEDGQEIAQHVACARRRNGLELLVTSSPETALQADLLGVTTLLYIRPGYQRPEFRPDHPRGVRSWAALSGQMQQDVLDQGRKMESVAGDSFEH